MSPSLPARKQAPHDEHYTLPAGRPQLPLRGGPRPRHRGRAKWESRSSPVFAAQQAALNPAEVPPRQLAAVVSPQEEDHRDWLRRDPRIHCAYVSSRKKSEWLRNVSLIGSTMSLESPERKRRVSSHPLLAIRAFKNVQFPGASKGSFATRKRQPASALLHKTVCYRPYPGGAPPSLAGWSRSLLIVVPLRSVTPAW